MLATLYFLNGGPADNEAVESLVAKGALNGAHFHSDEVESSFERVREAGPEVVEELADRPWDTRDFAVRDPSGNLVRVDQAPA